MADCPAPDVPVTVTVAMTGFFDPPLHAPRKPTESKRSRPTAQAQERRGSAAFGSRRIRLIAAMAARATHPKSGVTGNGRRGKDVPTGRNAIELGALMVMEDEPVGVTEGGEKLHAPPVGRPEQERATA